jgi:hypothetical protein
MGSPLGLIVPVSFKRKKVGNRFEDPDTIRCVLNINASKET